MSVKVKLLDYQEDIRSREDVFLVENGFHKGHILQTTSWNGLCGCSEETKLCSCGASFAQATGGACACGTTDRCEGYRDLLDRPIPAPRPAPLRALYGAWRRWTQATESSGSPHWRKQHRRWKLAATNIPTWNRVHRRVH